MAQPPKCAMCGAPISPVRLEVSTRTRTCSRHCSSEFARKSNAASVRRYRAKRKAAQLAAGENKDKGG